MMRMEVGRYNIVIVPETPQDEAFIEEVLHLKHDKDATVVVRNNAFDLHCMGNLEIRPRIEGQPK